MITKTEIVRELNIDVKHLKEIRESLVQGALPCHGAAMVLVDDMIDSRKEIKKRLKGCKVIER